MTASTTPRTDVASRRAAISKLSETGATTSVIAARLGLPVHIVQKDIERTGKTTTRKHGPFSPDQAAFIEMLIADECPPGEIATTMGVTIQTIHYHFPDAGYNARQRKEWQSIRAFITKCEQANYAVAGPRKGLPPLCGWPLRAEYRTPPEPKRRPGPAPKPWSQERTDRAHTMLRAGYSYGAVAKELGVDRKTVAKRFPGYTKPNPAKVAA